MTEIVEEYRDALEPWIILRWLDREILIVARILEDGSITLDCEVRSERR